MRGLWIYEDLAIELSFVFRNSHSFQIAECVGKIWKAYLESVYTINDVMFSDLEGSGESYCFCLLTDVRVRILS